MEQGLFPSNQSMFGGIEELEEERRLAYVAITRAKEKLYITNAATRMLYGSTSRNLPSRFLKEIPENLCQVSTEAASYFNDFSTRGLGFSGGRTGGFKPNSNSYSFGTSSKAKPFGTASAATQKATQSTNYTVGQTVEHNTFGKGMIISVIPMGNDNMLEIAFENVGTKKLMAGYAKLKII